MSRRPNKTNGKSSKDRKSEGKKNNKPVVKEEKKLVDEKKMKTNDEEPPLVAEAEKKPVYYTPILPPEEDVKHLLPFVCPSVSVHSTYHPDFPLFTRWGEMPLFSYSLSNWLRYILHPDTFFWHGYRDQWDKSQPKEEHPSDLTSSDDDGHDTNDFTDANDAIDAYDTTDANEAQDDVTGGDGNECDGIDVTDVTEGAEVEQPATKPKTSKKKKKKGKKKEAIPPRPPPCASWRLQEGPKEYDQEPAAQLDVMLHNVFRLASLVGAEASLVPKRDG